AAAASPDSPFSLPDTEKLLQVGVRVVYIRTTDHARFLQRVEAALVDLVDDPGRAASEKAAIIYESSLELMNELLGPNGLAPNTGRLENVARSTVKFVLRDAQAFGHLFMASHHDFYTATHMVNVGTWMVPLAVALGHRAPTELAVICRAGMLHDIGKIFVPSDVLNKRGQLTAADWQQLREHAALGERYLMAVENLPEMIRTVARQHHERNDGSGYPAGLARDAMHPVSRICSVIDSFDAMTAIRPFKSKTMTVSDALLELRKHTPQHYDPEVVEAWGKLLSTVTDRDAAEPAGQAERGTDRRANKRYACRMRATVLVCAAGAARVASGFDVMVHSISRSGLGLLSSRALAPGEQVTMVLQTASGGTRRVRGDVVRCRRHADGIFEVGLVFARDLPGRPELGTAS
ncbi:MAG: HD domain-containing phosphohydrolase, partial [Planctomycetota bacterium]